jgi:hypothetical protein
VNYALFVGVGVLGLGSAFVAFKSKSEAVRKFIGPPQYMLVFGAVLVFTGAEGLFHKSMSETFSTTVNLLMILALLGCILWLRRST